MTNDMTPARTLGLLIMAAIVWASLIVNSFWNDDSPIQFRADCSVIVGSYAGVSACRTYLVWAR